MGDNSMKLVFTEYWTATLHLSNGKNIGLVLYLQEKSTYECVHTDMLRLIASGQNPEFDGATIKELSGPFDGSRLIANADKIYKERKNK